MGGRPKIALWRHFTKAVGVLQVADTGCFVKDIITRRKNWAWECRQAWYEQVGPQYLPRMYVARLVIPTLCQTDLELTNWAFTRWDHNRMCFWLRFPAFQTSSCGLRCNCEEFSPHTGPHGPQEHFLVDLWVRWIFEFAWKLGSKHSFGLLRSLFILKPYFLVHFYA